MFFFIPKSPESRRKLTEYHSLPFHAATAAKTHYGELLMPRGTGWGNKNAEQTPRAIESWLCKQMCFLIVCRKRGACVAQPGSNSHFFSCFFASHPPRFCRTKAVIVSLWLVRPVPQHMVLCGSFTDWLHRVFLAATMVSLSRGASGSTCWSVRHRRHGRIQHFRTVPAVLGEVFY